MIEQTQLLSQLGDGATNSVVYQFGLFAILPKTIMDGLAGEAMTEIWGKDNFVLEKYLAINIRWSIEQGRYVRQGEKFIVTAGNLQTRYGTPLYLVFGPNKHSPPPWRCIAAGARVAAADFPDVPEVPPAISIDRGAEIVMQHDHILGENQKRVQFLAATPPVAQICAVAGAVQWSINRGLHFPYWYFGKMSYLVPLYLQDREDISKAPDLVAPVQVNAGSLLVRTVLEPHMPYANARVAVKRHDLLRPWMLDSWKEYSKHAEKTALENPEGQDLAVTGDTGQMGDGNGTQSS